MPDISTEENDLLKMLGSSNVLTMGKGRMKEVQAFIYRLMFIADKAETSKNGADLLANALWLSASGVLTEEAINENPRLSPEQKEDCLKMLQLRFDADAWRAHTDFDLPELPSISVQGPITKEEAESNAAYMDTISLVGKPETTFRNEERDILSPKTV